VNHEKDIIFIFIFLCFSFNINALCYDDDLNTWALNVQIQQIEFNNSLPNELNDNKPLKETMDYAYILALSEYRTDVVMKADLTMVQDDGTDFKESYEWKYIPGHKVWGIPNYNTKYEVNYNITVKGAKDSACPNEVIKTFKYKIEPFNFYKKTEHCEKYPEAPLCDMYKDTSDITNEEFNKEMELYDKEHGEQSDKTFFDKLLEYAAQYAVFILVPFVFISLFYILRIKKVQKEEKDR
jgi:hypothetical protein